MRLNKTLYVLGDVGEISEIPDLIKKNACSWLYFVYKAGPKPLNIGTLQSLRLEDCGTVVLGIASSRRLARKLALHIVLKALSLDVDFENGLSKLIRE